MAASSLIPMKFSDAVSAITPVNGNTTPQRPPVNGNTTPQRPSFLDMPKQNLRGLNKPKCIKCGNVARSRCPFQSCKSCCSKAENPCYIHVLKQTSILPDKSPSSSSPSIVQPSAEAPSTGRTSWRLSSLRQLSSTYVNSLRAKKPLTRKDAVNINKWRFSKLKEHVRGDIEAENEAFERYLQNVSLLEETFSIEDGPKLDDHPTLETNALKVMLKSNALKADRFREKIKSLVDQKLRKLREWELDDDRVLKKPKVEELRDERTAAVNDLVDKLNKARSEDDLKSCLDMKDQLFNQSESKVIDVSSGLIAGDPLVPKQGAKGMPALCYSLPQASSIVPIDQDTLSRIDAGFSSLNQIAEL